MWWPTDGAAILIASSHNTWAPVEKDGSFRGALGDAMVMLEMKVVLGRNGGLDRYRERRGGCPTLRLFVLILQ